MSWSWNFSPVLCFRLKGGAGRSKSYRVPKLFLFRPAACVPLYALRVVARTVFLRGLYGLFAVSGEGVMPLRGSGSSTVGRLLRDQEGGSEGGRGVECGWGVEAICRFSIGSEGKGRISLGRCTGRMLLVIGATAGYNFAPRCRRLRGLCRACRRRNFRVLSFPYGRFNRRTPNASRDVRRFYGLACNARFRHCGGVGMGNSSTTPLFGFLGRYGNFTN